MLYKAIKGRLALLSNGGKILEQFFNGRLLKGDGTTGTGAGNALVPDLSNADTALQNAVLNSAGSTDLEKIGLGEFFFEAPILDNTAVLVVGEHYDVETGPVTYNGTTYNTPGDRFECVTGVTAFTGAGTVSLGLASRFYVKEDIAFRAEKFKMDNLVYGDEATFDNFTVTGEDFKHVR